MTIRMERAEPEVPKGATVVEVDESVRDIMISRGWVVSNKAKPAEKIADKTEIKKESASEVKTSKATSSK